MKKIQNSQNTVLLDWWLIGAWRSCYWYSWHLNQHIEVRLQSERGGGSIMNSHPSPWGPSYLAPPTCHSLLLIIVCHRGSYDRAVPGMSWRDLGPSICYSFLVLSSCISKKKKKKHTEIRKLRARLLRVAYTGAASTKECRHYDNRQEDSRCSSTSSWGFSRTSTTSSSNTKSTLLLPSAKNQIVTTSSKSAILPFAVVVLLRTTDGNHPTRANQNRRDSIQLRRTLVKQHIQKTELCNCYCCLLLYKRFMLHAVIVGAVVVPYRHRAASSAGRVGYGCSKRFFLLVNIHEHLV
jgi:hypothetical protein